MDEKKEAELINILNGDLPVIRIVSEEDEMFTRLELEMEDATRAMLVSWGKEVATDDEYAEIAIRRGLEEFVERYGESDEDEDNNN